MKTSDAICNISSTELSQSEISLLNKGLNFCATTNQTGKMEYRKLRHRKWSGWYINLRDDKF